MKRALNYLARFNEVEKREAECVAEYMVSFARAERAGQWIPDEAWPPRSVVEWLAKAVEHLLDKHDCDTHYHEEFRIAAAKARRWLAIEGEQK